MGGKYVYFKNAWVSITRNKGRNILIGIIIVVISCACAVTLAIKNSANKLIESYENQYQVEASIGVNRKEMMENFNPSSSDKDSLIDNYNSIDSISIDDIKIMQIVIMYHHIIIQQVLEWTLIL